MELQEIVDGLWRWTAPHPDWEPGAETDSPGDWEQDVGCVLYEAGDAMVFIDPLLPPDPAGAWSLFDDLVGRRDRVVVLTTLRWHGRSREAVVARYGAATPRARAEMPAGVEPFRVRRAGETIFWLPEHRALVPGDRLLGDGAGGLRVCPESWLGYLPGITRPQLVQALRPLLELPVERVLVSHGAPVLKGGHAALERALA